MVGDLVGRLHLPQPPPRGGPRKRPWPPCRLGRGVPALPAVAPDLRLPVQVHRHAVGRAAELLGRHQRRDRLHRQPGLDPAAGTNQGRLLALIYFAMSPWPCSGWARASASSSWTCAPARGPGASPSSSSGRCSPPSPAASSPQRLLAPLRRRRLPAPAAAGRPGDHHPAQPRSRLVVVEARGRGRARRVGPEHHTQRTQATEVAAGHQRPGPAGRRRRLLSRPAGAGGLPGDPRPVAVRHDHLPPRDRARRSWTGSTTPSRARGQPGAFLADLLPRRRPGTASGWCGSRATRPTGSSASRSWPCC